MLDNGAVSCYIIADENEKRIEKETNLHPCRTTSNPKRHDYWQGENRSGN